MLWFFARGKIGGGVSDDEFRVVDEVRLGSRGVGVTLTPVEWARQKAELIYDRHRSRITGQTDVWFTRQRCILGLQHESLSGERPGQRAQLSGPQAEGKEAPRGSKARTGSAGIFRKESDGCPAASHPAKSQPPRTLIISNA